jgi:hypothetical protein
VIVGCLAAFPVPAPAATVGRAASTTLTFDAARGETNRLTISTPSAGEYQFQDVGAPLTAGAGCRATPDIHVVLCRTAIGPQELTGFHVELQDRNDTFVYTGAHIEAEGFEPFASVRGGSGDDRLTGGKLHDEIYGDGGADVLRGGQGSDLLDGGAGGDRLSGGPSHDFLYGEGESDRLTAGGGDDVLHGGLGPDRLDGGTGNDEFRGSMLKGHGGDLIRGGHGIDSAVWTVFPRIRVIGRRRLWLRPPRIKVTLDGRANDGPPGQRDDVARDVERARSQTPFRTTVRGGVAAASPPPIVTIHRLSLRGTAGAEKGTFVGDATVREGRSRSSPTEVSLPPSGFDVCGAGASRIGARAARLPRRTIHRLRARARGRFRTRGRYAAATIRGTSWTMTDRCDGTLTRVTSGRVLVRDLHRRRNVLVRAGKSYLARGPRR